MPYYRITYIMFDGTQIEIKRHEETIEQLMAWLNKHKVELLLNKLLLIREV